LARTLVLSRLAADQSRLPLALQRSTSRWCSCSHTPACCHSTSRRQQVTPLPQPNSLGVNALIQVAQATLDTGVRFVQAITNFDVHVSVVFEGGQVTAPTCLFSLVMAFLDQRSPLDSARTLMHLMDRASHLGGKCVYYGNDGYGVRDPGKTAVQNSGNVTLHDREGLER
jgi:hypothetical protein